MESTNFSFEGVKRSVLYEVATLCKIFYQNDWLLRNRGPLKIGLIQCHEVLWIHNIDAIGIHKSVNSLHQKIIKTINQKSNLVL